MVATRVIMKGQLVGPAVDSGAMSSSPVPADLARDGVLTSMDDVRCLVAAQNIPLGTILYRSMFVAPSVLNLDGGLDTTGSLVRACPRAP